LIGEPVLVKAANDHIMDFTYVEDIAQGFHLACTHANAAGEAFNMTFGAARRLTELVDVIKEYEPSIQTASDDIDDSDRPTRGTLSVEKARTMLGYAPEWPLERGIKAYLEYMRGAEYLNRGVA
jgi:nucleoside-diphosphate-sugar epimerase